MPDNLALRPEGLAIATSRRTHGCHAGTPSMGCCSCSRLHHAPNQELVLHLSQKSLTSHVSLTVPKKTVQKAYMKALEDDFSPPTKNRLQLLFLSASSGVDLFQLPALCLRKPDTNNSCANQLPIGQEPGCCCHCTYVRHQSCGE